MTELTECIVAAMRANEYQLDEGPGEINVVYVSGMNPDGTLNDNALDKWNDLRCVITFKGGKPVMAGKWVATTEPGRYYDEVHVINPSGAAFLAFGQYWSWQVGHHHGDPSRPALVQTGDVVTVDRDRKRTGKRSEFTDTGYFGINQHDGQDGSTVSVGKHSAGCLVVRSRGEHLEFMTIVKSDPRYVADHSYVFATALLSAEDI